MPLLTGSETLIAKFYIEGVYSANGYYSNANPGGPNGAVQFNDAGNFAGSANLLYSDANGGTLTTGTLVVGNIISAANTLSISNLVSNGTITGNVITANVANIANLTSNVANIANLTSNVIVANTANIANLTSNVIVANTANIANLTSNVIVANTANVANVNSNVITANVANLVSANVTGNLAANVFTSNIANLVELTVTGNANLGDVGNVHIGGGLPGQFLQTDSTGNLIWANAATGNVANAVPYMMWDVTSAAAGQSFTNANLVQYTLAEDMSVFLNGVFVKPTDFTISGDTITFTGFLNNGDLLEVASKSIGTGNVSSGTVTRVGGTGSGLGFTLTGNVISDGNLTLTTPNADQLRANLSLGNVSNSNFNGNGSQFLSGNGVWSDITNATFANSADVANGLQSTVANAHITGGTTGQMLITDGTGNLSFATPNVGTVTRVQGNGSGLGFTLSGDVTSSGNLTLTTPNAASLTSSMGLGNVATANFNGNASQVLSGTGTWVAQTGGGSGGTTGYFVAYETQNTTVSGNANVIFPFDTQQYDTIGVAYNTTTGVFTLPVGTYRMTTMVSVSWETALYAGRRALAFASSSNNQPLIPLGGGGTPEGYGIGILTQEMVGGSIQTAYTNSQVDVIYVATAPISVKLLVLNAGTPFNTTAASSMTIQKIA